MSNAERVLEFVRSIAPERATNSDIRERTGIRSHPQVFQITQALMKKGLIKGRKIGSEWEFWVQTNGSSSAGSQADTLTPRHRVQQHILTPIQFEAVARNVMDEHFGAVLMPRAVPGVRKTFDLVSEDFRFVGDAKYFTMVGGERLPPAKFSVIAEHVWLLEKCRAQKKFLVFGNDRRVPVQWLSRYGNLLAGVEFYYIGENEELELLAGK